MMQSSGVVLSPSILVEKQINYSIVKPFQHKMLVKAAIKLWTQKDIRNLVKDFYCPYFPPLRVIEEWKEEIEDTVIEKVSKLQAPKLFKDKLLYFIKPIGLQILAWIDYHDTYFDFDIELPDEFFWTPQGSIDKKKTAEVLIKNESIDIVNRYKLACVYCLESDIHMLWNKIPEDQRKSLYSDENPMDFKLQDLAVLWTHEIKGEMAKLDNVIDERWRKCTSYQYAFEYSAMNGNKAAVEYLLQKLTPEERKYSLLQTAGYVANIANFKGKSYSQLHKEFYTDTFCFLLSLIDQEEQFQVFASYPWDVLINFLYWPWQGFFMETAKHMQMFISENLFESFLEIFIDRAINGYKDCNYQKIFGELWLQSPIDYRKRFIKLSTGDRLISDLLLLEDDENILFILQDATFAAKKKWIFCKMGNDICTRVLSRTKVDFNALEFFVDECVSSKEMGIELKENFRRRNQWYFTMSEMAIVESRWDNFYQILDNVIQKYDKKRSLEEGDTSPAKRLQNEELSTSKE